MTKALLIALATLMVYLVAKPYTELFTRTMSRTQAALDGSLSIHTENSGKGNRDAR